MSRAGPLCSRRSACFSRSASQQRSATFQMATQTLYKFAPHQVYILSNCTALCPQCRALYYRSSPLLSCLFFTRCYWIIDGFDNYSCV